MEPVAVFADSLVASAVVGAVSVVAFVASGAVLIATATERPIAGLARGRLGCVVVTGPVVAASVVDVVDRWALALACVGFLMSLQAVALAFGRLAPLRAYLDRRTAAGEPVWWDDFERGFGRYVARRARRSRLRRIGGWASEATPVDDEDRTERSES